MTRYRQFCALARAAEFLGERWTLLIVRELLLGPQRFADLLRNLPGVSPAVLTGRLRRMQEAGLVRRSELPPPAAVSVYELTGDGSALRPSILELISWGGRFLFPPRKGDTFQPAWMRLALEACARKGPTPRRSFILQLRRGGQTTSVHVAGGRRGTHVSSEIGPAEATVAAPAEIMFALVSGALSAQAAVAQKRAQVKGSLSALRDLPLLFDMAPPASANRQPSGRHQLHPLG